MPSSHYRILALIFQLLIVFGDCPWKAWDQRQISVHPCAQETARQRVTNDCWVADESRGHDRASVNESWHSSPFSFSPLLPSTQSSLIMHLFVWSGQSNRVRFLSEYIHFSVFVMVLSLLNHNKSRRVHVFGSKCNACFQKIHLIHSPTNILLLTFPCFDAYQSTNSLDCLDHVIPVSHQVCSCVMWDPLSLISDEGCKAQQLQDSWLWQKGVKCEQHRDDNTESFVVCIGISFFQPLCLLITDGREVTGDKGKRRRGNNNRVYQRRQSTHHWRLRWTLLAGHGWQS